MGKRRYAVGGVGYLPASGEVLEAPAAYWIPPFLLLALQREEYLHEHDLIREMVTLGFGASRAQTIRRALREMEAEGMVTASEPGSAPFGRRYGISAAGEDYLEAWANSLASYRDEVDLLLGLYDEPSVPVGCGRYAPL